MTDMTMTAVEAAALPARKVDDRADAIIKEYVIATMTAGLVPVPVFDLVAITGIQIKMAHSLCRHYGVPFQKEVARSIVLSIISGALPVKFGAATASLLKLIPGLGTASGTVGVVVLSGALSYATGRVFAEHLASGGTLLTLRTADVTGRFRSAF